jgi:hypothetical protein
LLHPYGLWKSSGRSSSIPRARTVVDRLVPLPGLPHRHVRQPAVHLVRAREHERRRLVLARIASSRFSVPRAFTSKSWTAFTSDVVTATWRRSGTPARPADRVADGERVLHVGRLDLQQVARCVA